MSMSNAVSVSPRRMAFLDIADVDVYERSSCICIDDHVVV